MTSEQFVEKYNQTAAECYFHHRIAMGDIPKRVLHRQHHRVAGGDCISFMFTESGGQIRAVTMFDNRPTAVNHRQLHSIAASIMVDVLTGLPKAERKLAIEQLGLPTGKYGEDVQIGKYVGMAKMLTTEDEKPIGLDGATPAINEWASSTRRVLMVQLRQIKKGKGVTVHVGGFS